MTYEFWIKTSDFWVVTCDFWYVLYNLDKKKCLSVTFSFIFSRLQIDIYRFISKDNGFDISCKLHEIPKPIFQGKKEQYLKMSLAENLPSMLIVYRVW